MHQKLNFAVGLRVYFWEKNWPVKYTGNFQMLNEPIEVTLRVTGVLEELGIPYLIGGSLASTLYGMIRATQDSDIVAEIKQDHVNSFVDALQNEFFIDEEMISSAVQHRSSFNIIHRDTMF